MGLFDPFGQSFEGVSATKGDFAGHVDAERNSFLFRAAIAAFWVIVATIIGARLFFAYHGSLFVFAH